MNITNATFRFMRRVQVREYEPMEGEITISVAFGDDEPVDTQTLSEGLASVKAAVHSGIQSKLSGVSEGETIVAANDNTPKSRDDMTAAEKRADTLAKKADAAAVSAAVEGSNPDATNNVVDFEPAPPPAETASFDDDFGAPAAPEVPAAPAGDDLDGIEGDIQNEFLLAHVNKAAEVLTGDGVRKILKETYKVDKLGSLSQDMRRPFIRSLRSAVDAAKT